MNTYNWFTTYTIILYIYIYIYIYIYMKPALPNNKCIISLRCDQYISLRHELNFHIPIIVIINVTYTSHF